MLSAPISASLRMPALRALLIQLAALGGVLLLAAALSVLINLQFTLATTALLQGMVAAALAWWARMARWWIAIHLVFVPAALLLSAMNLPSWLYLLLFSVSLGVYWQTFRTQVPFYPSTEPVWQAVARLLPLTSNPRFMDLGSGFGGLVMHLAAQRRDGQFSGIEFAPVPWLFSLMRAYLRGSSARFLCGDYARLDLGQYDVVFAYLSPAAMPALWRKANAEMRTGSLLLSYEFPIPGIEPDIEQSPRDDGPKLYGWRL